MGGYGPGRGPVRGAETRYLWLLRLIASNRHEEEKKARIALFPQDQKSIALMAPRLQLSVFRIAEAEYYLLPWVVLDQVMAGEKPPVADAIRVETGAEGELYALASAISAVRGVKAGELIGKLDEMLAPSNCPASLFDSDVEKSMWMGFAYTGIFRMAWLCVRSLYSLESAEADLARFDSARSDFSLAVRQWYTLWLRSHFHKEEPDVVVQKMRELPSQVGAVPVFLLWESVRGRVDWSDPTALVAVRAAVARMDSRVQHRKRLRQMARESLRDILLIERINRSIVDQAPGRFTTITALHWKGLGDSDRLREMVRDPSVDVENRAWIVDLLHDMGQVEVPDVLSAYEELGAGDPGKSIKPAEDSALGRPHCNLFLRRFQGCRRQPSHGCD